MLRTFAMIVAGSFAVGLCGCATEHSEADMLSGSHVMGSKNMMSDQAMPSHSMNCTPEALANMPPEHRRMCETQAPPPK